MSKTLRRGFDMRADGPLRRVPEKYHLIPMRKGVCGTRSCGTCGKHRRKVLRYSRMGVYLSKKVW